MKLDWKKRDKVYYVPGTRPERIRVPAFDFFAVRGAGDPNAEGFGEYVQVLYSVAYAVRMAPKSGTAPEGYYEYTVFPLEGVWDISEDAQRAGGYDGMNKSQFVFDLMIRQPEFVSVEYAHEVVATVASKKPQRLLTEVRFERVEEGDCVQMMHVGPYDDEPASFALMETFCAENGLERVSMVHREIYLSDPRKTSAEKMKTVLRFQVRES